MADKIRSNPLELQSNSINSYKITGDTPVKTLPPTESAELKGKIDAKMSELRNLWSDYANHPNPRMEGAISKGVSDLESLLSLLPFKQDEYVEGRDYVMACRVSLEDIHQSPPAQPTHRGEVLRLLCEDYTLQDVKGDGNCGIRAVLAGIDPAMNNTAEVHLVRGEMVSRMKTAMYDEIDNHWNEVLNGTARYVPILGEHEGDKSVARKMVDSYCEYMGRHGEWIGELELPFLAQTVDRSIVVYDPHKVEISTAGNSKKLVLNESMLRYGNSDKEVAIYHDVAHYQSLQPKA